MPFIQKYPTPTAFMVASSYASSNPTGLCTVHPFLPANYTSLPDTGNLREMLKWQLFCLHRSVLRSPYAAMQFLDINSGMRALHELKSCVSEQIPALGGALAGLRNLYVDGG